MEPFQPSRLWLDPHAQTVLANTLRPIAGVAFHRLRLDTPDGDFIDLDFPSIPGVTLDRSAPMVILLHGLEGSARRGYACEIYRQLAQRGLRAVGMNFRSCSGVMNRTPRLYHAGVTDDVAVVIDWLEEKLPDVPKGGVGFSLGANTLLKYLGERGSESPLQAAAVVSPPFDLARVAMTFAKGSGRLYAPRFIKGLRQKALTHAQENSPELDVERILSVQTVRDFDDAFTAPLHGYRDADDYYAQNSCAQYLPAIKIPTLVIRAMDDPFFAHDIPHTSIIENEFLFPALVPHGGHVGFAEGVWPGHFEYWAERQAARFLQANIGN